MIQWTDPDHLDKKEDRLIKLSPEIHCLDVCQNLTYSYILGLNCLGESLNKVFRVVSLVEGKLVEVEKEIHPDLKVEVVEKEEENDIRFAPNVGRSYDLVAFSQS